MTFWEQFDDDWAERLGIRMPTFRAVFREAELRKVKTIVETGTVRKNDNWEGDGQSTVMWAQFASERGMAFATVDISREATDLARQLCPTARVHCGDSVKYLTKLNHTLDLLYLDSYDLDMEKPHDAALHCLMEFSAAQKWLHSGSIVFIDDCPIGQDMVIRGKGLYVAQYFRQIGVMPFTFGYQAAWIMP